MKDLFTSQSQACWQERVWKEAAARVSWKINYGHQYVKEGALPRKRLRRAPFSSALAVGSLPATSSPDNKDQTARDQGGPGSALQESRCPGPLDQGRRRLGGPKSSSESAGQTKPKDLGMRQVPPSTLQLLFQGISHDGQGRALYLRERHRQKPEEKFQYPVLSSWEYGWHVGDAMKDTRSSVYARSKPITQTFYIKNGVFHLPRQTDQLM
ncbi:protein ATP6V1FNB [Sturnira hondurensis]|uniref:protein ATP6V1FNB n=1 Tax=Sturnira hondurensis TaxID=192404 RepID=UPI00187A4994|nr:protein ATP6V1FNB [Sturnira hondurensis]